MPPPQFHGITGGLLRVEHGLAVVVPALVRLVEEEEGGGARRSVVERWVAGSVNGATASNAASGSGDGSSGSGSGSGGGVRDRWEAEGYQAACWEEAAGGERGERGVDDALHLKMRAAAQQTHSQSHGGGGGGPGPSLSRTMVLLSGDGNKNYGKATFPVCLELALANGWQVEVWAWEFTCSCVYRELARKWPAQVSLRWLDPHRATVTTKIHMVPSKK